MRGSTEPISGNTQIAPPLLNVGSWSLYGPPTSGRAPSSGSCRSPHRVRARLRGRPMAEPLDEPFGVVPSDELRDDDVCLLEALELMQIDALLLERAHEPLGDAVALGLA